MKNFLTPWASRSALVFTVFVAAGLSAIVDAQNVHIAHCLKSCPQISDSRNEVVVRHLYAASIMGQSGLVEWVSYRVLPGAVGVASLLERWWQQDELVRTNSNLVNSDSGIAFVQPDLSNAQDRDYRVNEVNFTSEDRGRLAPMTSFAGTPYWDELNLLSNMAPIPQDLRVGSWSRLDQAINESVAELESVYVVAGPLYSGSGLRTDLEPTHFFKLITNGEELVVFRFPEDAVIHADYCSYVSTLDQVESESGLILLPALDNSSSMENSELLSLLNCQS